MLLQRKKEQVSAMTGLLHFVRNDNKPLMSLRGARRRGSPVPARTSSYWGEAEVSILTNSSEILRSLQDLRMTVFLMNWIIRVVVFLDFALCFALVASSKNSYLRACSASPRHRPTEIRISAIFFWNTNRRKLSGTKSPIKKPSNEGWEFFWECESCESFKILWELRVNLKSF